MISIFYIINWIFAAHTHIHTHHAWHLYNHFESNFPAERRIIAQKRNTCSVHVLFSIIIYIKSPERIFVNYIFFNGLVCCCVLDYKNCSVLMASTNEIQQSCEQVHLIDTEPTEIIISFWYYKTKGGIDFCANLWLR